MLGEGTKFRTLSVYHRTGPEYVVEDDGVTITRSHIPNNRIDRFIDEDPFKTKFVESLDPRSIRAELRPERDASSLPHTFSEKLTLFSQAGTSLSHSTRYTELITRYMEFTLLLEAILDNKFSANELVYTAVGVRSLTTDLKGALRAGAGIRKKILDDFIKANPDFNSDYLKDLQFLFYPTDYPSITITGTVTFNKKEAQLSKLRVAAATLLPTKKAARIIGRNLPEPKSQNNIQLSEPQHFVLLNEPPQLKEPKKHRFKEGEESIVEDHVTILGYLSVEIPIVIDRDTNPNQIIPMIQQKQTKARDLIISCIVEEGFSKEAASAVLDKILEYNPIQADIWLGANYPANGSQPNIYSGIVILKFPLPILETQVP